MSFRVTTALFLSLSVCALGCDSRQAVPPAAGTHSEGEGETEADARGADAEVSTMEGPSLQVGDPDAESPSRGSAKEAPLPPSGVSKVGSYEALENSQAANVLMMLRKWVHQKKGKVHATLIDLESGKVLAAHRGSEAVNPASNQKVLTAAAVLDLLGPAYRFETELRARIDAGLASRLYLRGGGDPGLSTTDLVRLVRVAKGRGLKKVDEIVVDQTRFSDRYVPPAFEQQPEEWAPFRAPISALSVDRNAVSLNVMTTSQGQPAHVWYEPPGVVTPAGSVTTGVSGSGDKVGWRLDIKADPAQPVSKVSGSLAAGAGRRRYSRRLEDPRLAGGYALAALLREAGVEVSGAVLLADHSPDGQSLAQAAKKAPRIVWLPSSPLAELVRPLGKDSDNFTAETLLVGLSAAADHPMLAKTTLAKVGADGPWSTERGATVLKEWLHQGGIPTDGIVLKNGSGLFDANRLTTEVIALVLARMEGRPEVFPEFLAQLAVYGTDGTLRRRMKTDAMRSRVRAKTGTLRNTDALSGYVLRSDGRRPLVFSIIVSGARTSHGAVRAQMDKVVFGWGKGL